MKETQIAYAVWLKCSKELEHLVEFVTEEIRITDEPPIMPQILTSMEQELKTMYYKIKAMPNIDTTEDHRA